MPTEDQDLREIEELIQPKPSDDEQGSSGEKLGGSLTTDEGNTPAKSAFEKFISDDPKPIEDEEIEDTEDSEVVDTDVEPQDGTDSKDDESKDTDTTEDTDDDEDDDVEDIDLGIDLSDLDVDPETEEDEGDVDFDPREDLSKKVWKSTPKEAQELISSHRKHAKRLQRQVKDDSGHAKWSRDLFADAKKANTTNDQLMGIIETGFRLSAAAQAGKPDVEAAQVFGEIAISNGFRLETETPELDVSEIQTYLQGQIDEMTLPLDTAKQVMQLIRNSASQQKEAASTAEQKVAPVQHQRDWRDPENNGQPVDQTEAIRDAAVQKIATMTNRFEKKFGNDWPKLAKRIQQDVVAQQTATPVSAHHWPGMWKKAAEKHAKQFMKLSKERKGRSRLSNDSESLGRGAPVSGTDISGEKLSPREEFHRKHTK